MNLEECIEDVQHHMGLLAKELLRASNVKAAAKRARMETIELQKMFKEFRKLSCLLRLK